MVCSGVVVDENVLYECGEVVVKSDDIIGDVEMHIVHEIINRVEDVDLVVLERVVYDDVVVVHHDENDDVLVCSGVVVDENVLHECGEAGVDCDNVNSELNWHVEYVYIFHEMIVRVGDDGSVCVESDVFVEFKEADDDDDDDDDVIVVNYVIDENVLDECGEVGVKNDEVVIGDEYLGDVEVHVVHEIIYRGDIVVLEDVCNEDVVVHHDDICNLCWLLSL
ncbi:hypothetical protein EWB00_010826 [Schistosoma japonicum]|uniref:Uncharacterized protein n=1 Tax=Schistosoma japonicum TaxID=6182 RepID=A0A4Z2DMK4_SCHJA|nr:hypothetical protein EWB00_010826 [Schistosoma japonicum]